MVYDLALSVSDTLRHLSVFVDYKIQWKLSTSRITSQRINSNPHM